MRYYLTSRPSIQVDPGYFGWGIPAGARCCIDLVPATGIPLGLGETSGVVLAWTDGTLDGGELLAEGDIDTIDAALRMRQAWRSLTGGAALPQGGTLADLLWWQWTDGADPDGGAAPVPLVADSRRRCRIMLPGGRLLRSRDWRDSTPAHRSRVLSVLQRALHASREDALAGRYVKPGLGVDLEGHRHQLGYYARIYDDVPIERLTPATWRADETPLPPRTTLSDDFERAPQTGLGTASGGWSWSSVTGSWNIITGGRGEGGSTVGSVALELAAADLDADNHYAAIEFDGVAGSPTHGVITRYNGAASITGIHGRHATTGNTWQLYQFSGGSATLLDSAIGDLNAGSSLSLTADGSTHTLVRDGVTTFAAGTSSVGAGNRRTGLRTFNTAARYRSFESADLAAAEILLSASTTGTATASSSLATEITLSAAATGESTVASALTTEIPLSASVAASGALAASLATEITLSAAATAVGTAESALTTEITLSAAASASAAVAADLATEAGSLVAAVAATATAAAELSTEITLSGAAIGQATAAAALETEITLMGSADVIATVAAVLTTEILFSGAVTVQGTVSAELTAGLGLGVVLNLRAVSVTPRRSFASLTPDRAVRVV